MRTRSSSALRRRQHGQIMPVAVLGILIASAVLIMMFNTGQKITEKSQVANSADAAAYSGAVWTARHLNFMAYTNRAMIANHVAVGHFVSYMSWFRYIAIVVQDLEDYTSWVPYWGEIITVINEVISEVKDITEDAADYVVEGIDSLNGMYRMAQLETQTSLAIGGLNDIMQRTAKAYDTAIDVNDDGALAKMPAGFRAVLQAKVMYQRVELPKFVKRYTAEDDDNHITKLISQSYQADKDNRSWIEGNRGWSLSLLEIRFRKQGSTKQTQSDDSADWNATDRLQVSHRGLFGWKKWVTVGNVKGEASATEFYDDYQGVPSYYNVNGDPGDQHLDIIAVASKPQTQVDQSEALSTYRANSASAAATSTGDNSLPLAVAALARVEFKRPTAAGFAALSGGKVEYANLFNPFWEAHLTALEWPET